MEKLTEEKKLSIVQAFNIVKVQCQMAHVSFEDHQRSQQALEIISEQLNLLLKDQEE